jgi:hypothetical protein
VYIQKGDLVIGFCFHSELDGRSYAVNVIEELLQPIGAEWPYYEGVINISETQRWSMSRRLECQFLKVLHIVVTDHRGQSVYHSHAIFLLEELVIHLKIGSFQANFQSL